MPPRTMTGFPKPSTKRRRNNLYQKSQLPAPGDLIGINSTLLEVGGDQGG